MSARDDILRTVRAALAGSEPPADVPVPAPPGAAPADPVAHFAERVADYRAVVVRTEVAGLAAAVAESLPTGVAVVVPPALPEAVRVALEASAGSVVVDGPPLSAGDLDRVDAVVTMCRVGVAETGTIVLDHTADQGRRALTLVPDRHVCIVHADQVVPDVGDALALLDPRRPLTWISGPSATSDIELDRVEGVHGPRHLHVIVVG